MELKRNHKEIPPDTLALNSKVTEIEDDVEDRIGAGWFK